MPQPSPPLPSPPQPLPPILSRRPSAFSPASPPAALASRSKTPPSLPIASATFRRPLPRLSAWHDSLPIPHSQRHLSHVSWMMRVLPPPLSTQKHVCLVSCRHELCRRGSARSTHSVSSSISARQSPICLQAACCVSRTFSAVGRLRRMDLSRTEPPHLYLCR